VASGCKATEIVNDQGACEPCPNGLTADATGKKCENEIIGGPLTLMSLNTETVEEPKINIPSKNPNNAIYKTIAIVSGAGVVILSIILASVWCA
jgi:hypothetical protein